jgi:hypothetical protein
MLLRYKQDVNSKVSPCGFTLVLASDVDTVNSKQTWWLQLASKKKLAYIYKARNGGNRKKTKQELIWKS